MTNTGLPQNCHLDDTKTSSQSWSTQTRIKIASEESPSSGKIYSANQGMSTLSTETEKKRTVSTVILSNFSFWKSHLVCFMAFWEIKPVKHPSIFQLMKVWQSKQLAQYSGKNSSKIRMNGTSLNNNKKNQSKFSRLSYKDLFFHYTICSLSHQFLGVTEFWLYLLPREKTKKQ